MRAHVNETIVALRKRHGPKSTTAAMLEKLLLRLSFTTSIQLRRALHAAQQEAEREDLYGDHPAAVVYRQARQSITSLEPLFPFHQM